MSDSEKKNVSDAASVSGRAANGGEKAQSRHSGILFIQGSGEAVPQADSREGFVRFACGQLLQDRVLESGDLESGIVPDSNRSAFAAAYLFVGGVLVRSAEDAMRVAEAGEGVKLELLLLQASRESEFNRDRVWTIRKTAQALFSVGVGETSPIEPDAAVIAIGRFRRLAEALGDRKPRISVRYAYVSRGDAAAVGSELKNEAEGIVAMTRRSLEHPCAVAFDFISERDLIA